jgi:DNA-binding transcriptional ArsR family regulator
MPPRDLTRFEREVDASVREADPFFRELTAMMERELRKGGKKGIALLGGLVEDEHTGRKDWWASRHDIESLLASLERDPGRASALASALSSPSRLQIMGSLCYGPRRFSDLSRITGVRGGQLTHHIQPLTMLGLVKKEHGAYAITNKGWKALHTLLLAGL